MTRLTRVQVSFDTALLPFSTKKSCHHTRWFAGKLDSG